MPAARFNPEIRAYILVADIMPPHFESHPCEVRFQAASDQALLVYFGEHITLPAHRQVLKLLHLLQAEPVAGVVNLHPAYCSLLLKFDPLRVRHDQLQATLRQYLERLDEIRLPASREVEIPVCYGPECGLDLQAVAALHGMEAAQVVKLHSAVSYLVYFLGFLPGFAYLGDVNPALVTPRLETPRRQVPRGSVGIAGSQCGVYPRPTPGGWNLIGRTPVSLFRPDREAMSLLAIGDRVRFKPVSHDQFIDLDVA